MKPLLCPSGSFHPLLEGAEPHSVQRLLQPSQYSSWLSNGEQLKEESPALPGFFGEPKRAEVRSSASIYP